MRIRVAIADRIKNFPWQLFMLPVFFILHAANEYFGDLSVAIAAKLFFYLSLMVLGTYLLTIPLTRNQVRQVAVAYVLIVFVMFAKNIFTVVDEFLSKKLFFLLAAFIMLILILFLLRAKLLSVNAFNRGLLFVVSVLVVYEIGRFVIKTASPPHLTLRFAPAPVLGPWAGTKKPNVYLLLFDEYQGDEGLKAIFNFDNADFRNFLATKGFRKIQYPSSNYNYTYFSVPSLFSMGLLNYSDKAYDLDYKRVIKSINSLAKRNPLLSFFQKEGYSVINHSMFPLAGSESHYQLNGLDKDAYAVLFARTLPGWIKTDLLHTVKSNVVHRMAKDLYFQMSEYNNKVFHDTEKTVKTHHDGPVFVYSHFLLPHLPVLTDSAGTLKNIGDAAAELHLSKPTLRDSYLAYVGYANKISEKIIVDMLRFDPYAVILLISDHGLRRMENNNHVNNIQLAVKMPGTTDAGFYNGMSLVNLFRVVLNGIAGQKLPLVPDSSVIVK
jgi:hypothetical protein